MKFTKQDVVKALHHVTAVNTGNNIVEAGAVRNVLVFDKEVVVDVVSASPTLQAKKKLEVDIMKAVHDHVYVKADVKVNIIVEAPAKAPEIKGKAIPGVKNIIAVASGKGGVGKSTVTANIAASLAEMGFSVGLVDADIHGPSIPIMFDVAQEKPLSINVDGKSMIKPVESYGVKMLSIGFFAQANQAVVWRGPMASKALSQMINDAHWGELDFMLIDLPPGTGDIHLSLVQAVPVTGAIVVSTPQNIALADARKGVGMFNMDSINVPVLGIVENMAYFTPEELPENKYYIFGKEGAKHLSEDLGVPFLGEVPLVQNIREAADAGRPAVLQGATKSAEAFTAVTRRAVEELVRRNKDIPPTEAVKITTMAGCAAVN